MQRFVSVSLVASLGFWLVGACSSAEKREFASNGGATGASGVTSGGQAGSAGKPQTSSAGRPDSSEDSSAGASGLGDAGESGSDTSDAGAGGASATGGVEHGGGYSAGGKAQGGAAFGGRAGSASGGTSSGGAGKGGSHSGGSSSASGGTSGATTGGAPNAGGSAGSIALPFNLTSPTHADGAKFAGKFTCNGGMLGTGVNPELDWSGVPSGTQSFVLVFVDTTIGETTSAGQYWALWNIPATVTKLPEGTKTLSGALASAKQSGTFHGPCAQSLSNAQDDQYEFRLYALPSATLSLMGSSVSAVLAALNALSPQPPKAILHGHAGLRGQ